MADGSWSSDKNWHLLKEIKDGDPENDGELHHLSFSLPVEASNNPKFSLWFGMTEKGPIGGFTGANPCGYMDDIVVTGEPIAGK